MKGNGNQPTHEHGESLTGNLVRYFIIPVQSRRGQIVCWRGSVRANHHHVFWECPGIVHYWDSIRDGMERVLNIEIDLYFQVLYLGKMPQQLLGFSKMYMFKVMLVASKKAITNDITFSTEASFIVAILFAMGVESYAGIQKTEYVCQITC